MEKDTCAIFLLLLLLLLFLSMPLRKARSNPRTIVSQFTRNLYDRRYIPCLFPSLQTTAVPWRNWFDCARVIFLWFSSMLGHGRGVGVVQVDAVHT